MIKGTEGTQIIEHDWNKIKNTTDKYKMSKMSIKVFKYEIKDKYDSPIKYIG